MTEADILQDLHELGQNLEQIKATLAWLELKNGEAARNGPDGLIIPDSTALELRHQYSAFLAKVVQLHAALNPANTDLPARRREELKRRLFELQHPAQAPSIHDRLARGSVYL